MLEVYIRIDRFYCIKTTFTKTFRYQSILSQALLKHFTT